ncbi:MAG: hypothetical protein DRI34_08230 [Deltaproteobacteria bacterium]|nr:MAG: hypothetical protein DRI34_08230 [Deltaproteobacteria bacterium]
MARRPWSLLLLLVLAGCPTGGPQVVEVYPRDGSRGIPLDDLIEVTFDRPVRLSGTEQPLVLSLEGEPVPGLLTLSPDSRKLLFQPVTMLLAGRNYQATLAGDIEDLDGRSLAGRHEWSFTTLAGCDIEPAQRARLAAGPDGNGGWIIPGGRRISPLGSQRDLGSLPTNALLLPGGRYLVVTNNGYGSDSRKSQSLMVFDVAEPLVPALLQTLRYPRPQALFYGLASSADGRILYVAGAENDVVEVFSVAGDGTLTRTQQWPVEGFPAGLWLDESRGLLYVAAQTAGEIEALEISSGQRRFRIRVGLLPYDLQMSADGSKLYVSLWGRTTLYDPGQVAVVNPEDGSPLAKIEVGKNPEDLLLLPDGRLLVACSDADRVDVIDTASDSLLASWSLRAEGEAVGLSPVALARDEQRNWLYVACAQKNSLEVLDLNDGRRLGSIPTGWYPTAVVPATDGEHLFVVNGKGTGSGPITEPVNNETLMHGTLSAFAVPTTSELAQLSATVRANNQFALGFFPERCLNRAFPLPRSLGQPSPIKHVVFILRENKTYDQNLGDLEGTEADPAYVMFGEDYTPNLHALAREFCNLDNFHVEVEVSVQGHYFAVAATLNDYAEKVWQAGYRDDSRVPALGTSQPDYPAGLFIWHRLEQAGIPFRNYGEPYGLASEYNRFAEFVNMDYMLDLAQNLYLTPDSQRAEYFFAELEQGVFPPFVFITLPNDHTYGRKPGYPTPEWMVAENDYATGLIVEKITHSPFWPETLIIVTEDDPQSGMDHIDMHRSIALFISPYARRHHTSSSHYGFASLIRTYGLILGMPPLGMLDAQAAPVYDCFTAAPDYTPYQALPLQIDYQESSLSDPGARESQRMDFSRPDRAAGLGKVLWLATRPGEPVPPALLRQAEREQDLFEEEEKRTPLPVPLPPRKP